MRVRVRIFNSMSDLASIKPLCDYVMDHNDNAQRRVLGEQCRNAFEAGQIVLTHPE